MKKEKDKNKRYENTGHPGVRKDLLYGKYEARKQINGKMYRNVTTGLREAIHWMQYFHPGLAISSPEKIFDNHEVDKRSLASKTSISRPNGQNLGMTIKDVWEHYQKFHFPNLEPSSIEDRLKFGKYFLSGLFTFKMQEINASLLDLFMQKKVEEAKVKECSRRKNFDNELKTLKALFSWYRENYDEQFTNPILKRHRALGILVKERPRKAKMTLDQFKQFLDGFEDQFWRDVAETQFFLTARVQDVAGLQWENVFFEKEKVQISDVVIWGEDKKFWYLKEVPKNGTDRWAHINERLKDIFVRRWEGRWPKDKRSRCEKTKRELDFVFHLDGQALGYRQIQYQYNKALKKAGLDQEFSSTHFLRKAMAKATRDLMGLDAAQAVGGWKDRKIVEDIYTDVPLELCVEASKKVEGLLYGNGTPLGEGPLPRAPGSKSSPQRATLKIVR